MGVVVTAIRRQSSDPLFPSRDSTPMPSVTRTYTPFGGPR